MLTIEENQTQQLLWQRAKQAAQSINYDYTIQTLSLAYPPHAFGKVLKITHMLIANRIIQQQHINVQNPVQPNQQYYKKFKEEFKPQLNSLLYKLLNFKISDVSEEVWQSVTNVWNAEFDASSQDQVKQVSTTITSFFVWNHNVLKMKQLANQ